MNYVINNITNNNEPFAKHKQNALSNINYSSAFNLNLLNKKFLSNNINNTSSSNSNSIEIMKSPENKESKTISQNQNNNTITRNINSLSLITKKAMTSHINKRNAADSIDDKRTIFNNFINSTRKELFVDDGSVVTEPSNNKNSSDKLERKVKKVINSININTSSTPLSSLQTTESNDNIPSLKKYIAEHIIPNFSSSYNLLTNNNNNNNSSDQTDNYASSSLEEALNSDSPQIINIYNINNNYNIGNITIDNLEKEKKSSNTFNSNTVSNKVNNSSIKMLSNGSKNLLKGNIISPVKRLSTNSTLKSGSFINIAESINYKSQAVSGGNWHLGAATDRKYDKIMINAKTSQFPSKLLQKTENKNDTFIKTNTLESKGSKLLQIPKTSTNKSVKDIINKCSNTSQNSTRKEKFVKLSK